MPEGCSRTPVSLGAAKSDYRVKWRLRTYLQRQPFLKIKRSSLPNTYYQARVRKSKGWSRAQLRSMIFKYSARLKWWNPCFEFNFFWVTNYLFDFVRLPSYPGMHHVRASDANICPFQTMLSQRSVFLFTWSKTFGRERLTSLLASFSRSYDRGREKER